MATAGCGFGRNLKDAEVVVLDAGAGRSHAIEVVNQGNAWELSGMVCTRHDLEQANVSAVDLWRLNAQRCLASYVMRADGSVWVTAFAPVAGLTGEEFSWLARLVASEADRLEYRLTGEDNW